MIYDNEKNRLWTLSKQSIVMLKQLAKEIRLANMKDENFVRDWIDDLYQLVKDYDSSKSETPEEYLKSKLEQIIQDMEDLWPLLESYKHEQWLLNGVDKINELSVKY